MSHFSSMYTWHTPSAWPMTGILVLAWMYSTSWLEPRGMTRSITWFSLSRSSMPSREVTNPISPGSTAGARASVMMRCRIMFERMASLPPLSSSPFPLRMARLHIWGRASGRDSKMMSKTPRGEVTCFSTRPSATCVWRKHRPMGSSMSASERTPCASCAIFPSFNFSRFNSAESTLFFSDSAMSNKFSLRISASFATSASATRCITAARSAEESACRPRLAERAASAISVGDLIAISLFWL
mmetsp:Transcript_24884/g.41602  ORF Transcript_24884/g.41602 Transcript_24884/m.41602 type:complete len:242 (+) Transcript_24884:936-1661(+)